MKILELFSGLESMAKGFRAAGHEVKTLDFDPQYSPDMCMDILEFNINKHLGDWRPDIIWASPPCETFSVASIGAHWTGGKGAYVPKSERSRMGMEILAKTIEIIKDLNPEAWFIENPRGVMRKMKVWETIEHNRYTVTYCQYGDTRMKPTDIWSNVDTWVPRVKCKNGQPCHEAAPRGAKTGTQGIKGAALRAVIPVELVQEIILLTTKEKDNEHTE